MDAVNIKLRFFSWLDKHPIPGDWLNSSQIELVVIYANLISRGFTPDEIEHMFDIFYDVYKNEFVD